MPGGQEDYEYDELVLDVKTPRLGPGHPPTPRRLDSSDVSVVTGDQLAAEGAPDTFRVRVRTKREKASGPGSGSSPLADFLEDIEVLCESVSDSVGHLMSATGEDVTQALKRLLPSIRPRIPRVPSVKSYSPGWLSRADPSTKYAEQT